MHIVSWNVNSLGSLLDKHNELQKLVDTHKPDVLCLQEVKCTPQTYEALMKRHTWVHEAFPYTIFNHSTTKKGYSGTAILSKFPFENIKTPSYIDNSEGRVIAVRLANYTIIDVYTPNSGQKLERLKYRTEEWDAHFTKWLKELKDNKANRLIVCGDLNVTRTPQLDVWNPKCKSAGCTPQERDTFANLLEKTNMKDIYRDLHPLTNGYTYWSYRGNGRKENKGWRLDYILVSENMASIVEYSGIYDQYFGSDHAPIYATLKSQAN